MRLPALAGKLLSQPQLWSNAPGSASQIACAAHFSSSVAAQALSLNLVRQGGQLNTEGVGTPSAGPTLGSGVPAATFVSPSPEPEYEAMPRLLVFGGSGFVGSRVVEEATEIGLPVVSLSRNGCPPHLGSQSWAQSVEWIKADVFNPSSWQDLLPGSIGLVTCLGAFGSNDFMLKMNGTANVNIVEAASAAGVPRMAFISIHDYSLPDFVLSGYFRGKRSAEAALQQRFPESGVSLRPSFIHGTRQVGSIGLPLSAIGSPLSKALELVPAKSLAGIPLMGAGFVPPVSVKAVAKAAVAAATDPAVPAGVMDVWTIKQDYER
ncbi:hypothetical protein WJX74_007732 [Apatococcus lobatus]|uniref:NAD(P)-binding domain-containing protein n=2 Tax=Apatococcus TaxID=904362 RepID=A0AAW1SZ83_9CHLO